MDEKKISELYTAEAESSMPDMDALWSRIEGSLSENAPAKAEKTESKAHNSRKKITLKSILSVAAAAAALIILIPAALNSRELANKSAEADYAAAPETTIPVYQTEENFAANTQPFESEESETLSYDSLSLAASEQADISFNGKPYGDDYFCEDNVLEETDALVNAVVNRVYASEDGSCVYYELSAREVYSEKLDAGKTITVASCSPYEMMQNREYLIPIKELNGELRTVFDNAPQIEITLDGGLVYHNGWNSLDNVNSDSLIYPANGEDDYFYDRMKLTYNGFEPLIERWEALHTERN